MDLALNNLKRLICHKTNKPTNLDTIRLSFVRARTVVASVLINGHSDLSSNLGRDYLYFI